MSSSILNVLDEMVMFTVLAPNKKPSSFLEPIRNRQTLFRAQRVIEPLLDILKTHIDIKSSHKIPFFIEICVRIYRLLALLVRSYNKNSLYVFGHIGFLRKQLISLKVRSMFLLFF
jgi:hypothetical protein